MIWFLIFSSYNISELLCVARQGEKRKGAQSPKTPQSHKKRATRNGGDSEIDVEPSAARTPLRAVQQAAAAGDSSLFTSPARARPQLPGIIISYYYTIFLKSVNLS